MDRDVDYGDIYDYEEYFEPEYYGQLRPMLEQYVPDSLEYSREVVWAVVAHKYVTEHVDYRRTTTVQSPEETQEKGTGDCEDQTVLLNSLLKAGGLEAAYIVAFDGVRESGHMFPLIAFPGESQDAVDGTLVECYWEEFNQLTTVYGHTEHNGLKWFYADPTRESDSSYIGDPSGLTTYLDDSGTVVNFEVC